MHWLGCMCFILVFPCSLKTIFSCILIKQQSLVWCWDVINSQYRHVVRPVILNNWDMFKPDTSPKETSVNIFRCIVIKKWFISSYINDIRYIIYECVNILCVIFAMCMWLLRFLQAFWDEGVWTNRGVLPTSKDSSKVIIPFEICRKRHMWWVW